MSLYLVKLVVLRHWSYENGLKGAPHTDFIRQGVTPEQYRESIYDRIRSVGELRTQQKHEYNLMSRSMSVINS
jgi:hypothetical protein